MASEEHPCEDLMAEATALVHRASFLLHGDTELIVVGFRPEGSASVYIGDDRAYHFTSDGELRRAYYEDRLYKAERGRLVALKRERTQQETSLVRHELGSDEQASFLRALQDDLRRLRSAISANACQVVAQIPDESAIDRVATWLEATPAEIRVAAGPKVH